MQAEVLTRGTSLLVATPALAMNPSINYPPLSHQPGLLRSAAHESVVCGTPTRFVMSAYANRIMVVVTQTNNMGTLVRRRRQPPPPRSVRR